MIATKTGGLADTIEEISVENRTGTGLFLEGNFSGALVNAALKARRIFEDKPLFKALREGCYDRAIDTREGALAYLAEFYRLKNKIFVDKWEKHPIEEVSYASEIQEKITLDFARRDVKRISLKGSFDKFISNHRMEHIKGTNKWVLNNPTIAAGEVEVYFLLNDEERYIDPRSPVSINESFETVNVLLIKGQQS